MSGFFKGDEDGELELNVLYPCVKAALTKTISNMSLSKKALSSIAGKLGIDADLISIKTLTAFDLSDTIAEKIFISCVKPLTDGLVCDLSSPEDINVTIPSTDNTKTVKLTFFQKLKAFLERVFELLKNI